MTLDAPSGTAAYSPAQVRAAYGINALALDGTGQTIAIVDDFDDPASYSEALSVLLAAVPGPALAKTGSSAPAAMTPLDRVSAHDAVLGNWARTPGAGPENGPGVCGRWAGFPRTDPSPGQPEGAGPPGSDRQFGPQRTVSLTFTPGSKEDPDIGPGS